MQATYLATPSAVRQRREASRPEPADPAWRPLYRTGGLAAATSAIITPLAVVAFLAWPPPPYEGSALTWFAYFQQNALLGLLGLDLLFMAVWMFIIPLALALYAALRHTSPSAMAVALALELVAVGVYFASNTAFEMLTLSQGYAATTSDAERAVYLGAGQGMLATFHGTAFNVSYVLASLAGMIMAVVIWRSRTISRATGAMRLLASVLGLGLFLPVVGMFLGLFSVLFEWLWYVLLARDLFTLGRGGPPVPLREVKAGHPAVPLPARR